MTPESRAISSKSRVIDVNSCYSNFVPDHSLIITYLIAKTCVTCNAYYLSFRAPIGEDVDLEAEYLNQVSIHTFLSDPTADGDQHSWLLATLEPGESFSGLGMTVSCLSVDGETATVQVTLGN